MKKLFTELEKEFTYNNSNGIKKNGSNFKLINNMSNIILSAPHSVKQIRENKIKPEDIYTGSIVKYLIKSKKYDGIYRIYNDNDDPNYPLGYTLNTNNNKYIKEIINQNKYNFLLDIHGCSRNRPFDIELISAKGITCSKDNIKLFYDIFKSLGFNISVDSYFVGGQVVRQTSKYMDSLCIEINRNYRDIKKLNELKVLLLALEKSLNEVSKIYVK